MSHADLNAARWRELSDESAVSIARVIARENQMDLVEVRGHDYAGRHQRIALFERDGMRFSLVPADRVVLGYDGARFAPSPRQAASYADSADEYGLPAITEFIDSMTSPRRVAELPAMLVAVEALVTGVTAVAADDPRVQWGEDTPDDGYPFDHRAGLHREPNLWGLMIGQDLYRHEWTTEPGIVCGGDGGGATCGGSGFFLGWLTLATAYRDKDFGAWLNSKDGYIGELLIRPVVDMF